MMVGGTCVQVKGTEGESLRPKIKQVCVGGCVTARASECVCGRIPTRPQPPEQIWSVCVCVWRWGREEAETHDPVPNGWWVPGRSGSRRLTPLNVRKQVFVWPEMTQFLSEMKSTTLFMEASSLCSLWMIGFIFYFLAFICSEDRSFWERWCHHGDTDS